jgi:hypothetical protein
MTQLRQLTLKSNPLREPYASIEEARGALALLALADPGCTALDLADVGLSELPAQVSWAGGAAGGRLPCRRVGRAGACH